MLSSMRTQDKVFVTVASVIVIAGAGYTGYALFVTKDTDTTKTPTTTATDSASSTTSPTTSQQSSSGSSTDTTYKDGTYSETTNYSVPHGDTNSVTVKLTVANGTVTAVSVSHDYADHESAEYIDMFDQDIQSAVVGKSLNGLSISRVGGASLTSSAFDDALDTIRNDAQA